MKTWNIAFYNKKVEQQAADMPRGIRVRFLHMLEIMERNGPDLGMPHTRALGKGLYEIRAKSAEGIGRYFYCTVASNQIVVLHCFVKKTQKIPDRHLELAKLRMNEVKNART